ncbi:MAG: hypothetical protein CL910_17840 [Deltaproteobacteria bacterium]|jgi:hypothetical protein|nr:hypothetical protein [Deltaproteobacteria bacterium]
MKLLATIPIACLLLLLPAVPSAAKHERHAKRVDHRRPQVERYAGELQHAAADLEYRTKRLLKRARRVTHHPSRSERKALKRLKRLHREARSFHVATEEGRRLRHLTRDFREVAHAYDDAARRFRSLHPNKKMRRQFRRTGHLIGRIEADLERARLARIDRRERRHRHARRGWRHHRWDFAWR